DKTRAWERDRRERLNASFNNLSTLLPSYDPAGNLSKIEILQKAANYIRELHNEKNELLAGTIDPSAAKEIEQLKQRVEDLLKRIQQLVDLLRDAGITIPHSSVDPNPKPQRWTNKVKPEVAEKLLEKTNKKKIEGKNEAKKKKKKVSKVQNVKSNATPLKTIMNNSAEGISLKQINSNNITSKIPSIPTKKPKQIKKSKDQIKVKKLPVRFGDKLPTVAQLLGLTMNDIETSPSLIESAVISVHDASTVANPTLINTTAPLPPGFIVIQGNNNVQTSLTTTSVVNHNRQQPCIVMPTNTNTITSDKVVKSPAVPQQIPLVLSKSTSRKINKRKRNNVIAVTKSHLLTAPVMASSIQTCPPPAVLTSPSAAGLAGLGPGTLILANGNIVPVLPPTQFIVNSNHLTTPANPPLIMMQQQKNTVTITTSSSGAPLVTSSVAKSQKRLFQVLMAKSAKKKVLESTATTFANKVPIPALTFKHQTGKSKQVQITVPNNLVKSPNKPKSKSDNENKKPANSDITAEKSNADSTKAAEEIVKEKLTTVNKTVEKEIKLIESDNSHLNEQDSITLSENITDKKLNESLAIGKKTNKNEIDVIQQEKDLNFGNQLPNISDNAKHEILDFNNKEILLDKISRKKEENIAPPITYKRKKNDGNDLCNKRKQIKPDLGNQNSKNPNVSSSKISSDSDTPENTSLITSTTFKQNNCNTYSINALFTTKSSQENNNSFSNETLSNSTFNNDTSSEDINMEVQEIEDGNPTMICENQENLITKCIITLENTKIIKNIPQKLDDNNSTKNNEIVKNSLLAKPTVSDENNESESVDTSNLTVSQQSNVTKSLEQNVYPSLKQEKVSNLKLSQQNQNMLTNSSEINKITILVKS
ncbi:hypothetical protein L9F63_022995, partial [Diploptera punctata]